MERILLTRDSNFFTMCWFWGVIDFFVKTYIHKYADTGFLLANQYVERIPIPPITPKNQHIAKELEDLVNKILSITQSEDYLENTQKQDRVKEYEYQIDQLVYKLYGLTDKEIKIVEEKSLKKNLWIKENKNYA